jgi:hypothetical protein
MNPKITEFLNWKFGYTSVRERIVTALCFSQAPGLFGMGVDWYKTGAVHGVWWRLGITVFMLAVVGLYVGVMHRSFMRRVAS